MTFPANLQLHMWDGSSWVDYTSYLLLNESVQVTRGRADELSEDQSGTCQFVLDNTAGTFSSGFTTDQKIRLRWNDATVNDLFTGYVTSWQLGYVGGMSTNAVCTVQASDRLTALERHKFGSIIYESIREDSPFGYYPLYEDEHAVFAGDFSATLDGVSADVITKGSGGTLTFGQDSGLGTDTHTCPVFSNGDSSTNETFLRAEWASDPLGDSGQTFDRTLMCLFKTSHTPSGDNCTMVKLGSGGGFYWEIGIEAGGQVYGVQRGGDNVSLLSSGIYTDGAWHIAHLAITVGSSPTYKLYVDGSLVDSSSPSFYAYGISNGHLSIGGGGSATGYTGNLAHVAVFSTALSTTRISAHTSAMDITDAFANERTDQRIGRYLDWAGVAAGDRNLDTGICTTVSHYEIEGQGVASALLAMAVTEGGRVFIDASDKVTFFSRGHTSAQTIALTPDDLDKAANFQKDNQFLVNRMTVTSTTTGNILVEDTDSQAIHGIYEESMEIATTDPNDLRDAAQYRIGTYSTPQFRLPDVGIDVMTEGSTITTAIKALELGDTLSITGLPSNAPSTSMQLLVEGFNEVISDHVWTVQFNTSTKVGNFILNDPVYGLLDSGNTLGR